MMASPKLLPRSNLISKDEEEYSDSHRCTTAGIDISGTSRTDEDEKMEYFSCNDFKTLLKLLNINLPREIKQNDVKKSPKFSIEAKSIAERVKSNDLQIVRKPRLQCRKLGQAFELNVQDLTEMIFFTKEKNQQTLKKKWDKIQVHKRCGFRMRESDTRSKSAADETLKKKMRNLNIQGKKNETECLQAFVRENKDFLHVHYRREYSIEYGFLSGRMDFLLKTTTHESDTPQYIMLECKGTSKELKLESKYLYQTQAYLYILKKIKPQVSVTGAVIMRKYLEDYEDDEDLDETKEEDYKIQDDDNDKKYQEYEENQEEQKDKFKTRDVNLKINMEKKIEKLHKRCGNKALPLYLAVLNQIFEKADGKKVERDARRKNSERKRKKKNSERETKKKKKRKNKRKGEQEHDHLSSLSSMNCGK